MSHKDIEWAYTVQGATPAVKAVLVALAHCRNSKTGRCFPSQKRLADMTSFSLATVKRSLDALIEKKVIVATPMFKGGYQTNTEYTFDYAVTSVGGGVTVTSSQGDLLSHRAEGGVTVSQPSPQGEYPVIPTGIQPEVNTEITLIPPMAFERFWEVWPRKDGRKAALTAWNAAIRRASPELIVERATAYAQHPYRPPKQFVPHGATWLRGDRWTDPLPEAPEADRSKPSPTDRARAILALVPEPLKEIS